MIEADIPRPSDISAPEFNYYLNEKTDAFSFLSTDRVLRLNQDTSLAAKTKLMSYEPELRPTFEESLKELESI